VRSNQLSYEPWKNPTRLCAAKPVSRNWFERRFITMYLKKSNKKTAAFTASGLETLPQVFPAVKA
jgi:hypothetical protein